jgi:hypothetical protein
MDGNTLNFFGDLAASIQLMYASSIVECMKQRDKNTAIATASAMPPATPTVRSHSVTGGKGIQPLRKPLAGRGGRGTAGLTLSSKSKSGTGGRGSGLSLAAMRSGGNNASTGKSGGLGRPQGSTNNSSMGHNPTRATTSTDDLIEPRLLCQLQTDVFLSRGGHIQDALMHWCANALLHHYDTVLQQNWDRKTSDSAGDNVFGVSIPPLKQHNVSNTSYSVNRRRSGSSMSVDADGEEEQLKVVCSANLIDFIQKVLLTRPNHFKIASTMDKLAVLFAQDSCLLTSSTLTSLVKVIALVVSLEQLHFARAESTRTQIDNLTIHKISLKDAPACPISFLNTLSDNTKRSLALYQEEEADIDAEVRGNKCRRVYNCAPMISSGFELLTRQIQRALQTSYSSNGNKSGLCINNIEVS